MWISKASAIKQLRDATGFSEATCIKAVKAMVHREDGCRSKVHQSAVSLLIVEVNDIHERAETKLKIRPVKQSQIDRVDFSRMKGRRAKLTPDKGKAHLIKPMDLSI